MTVIVGAGLAGWRLAHTLDRVWGAAGNREPLVLIGDSGSLDKIALGEWATGVRDQAPTLHGEWVRPESRFLTSAATEVSLEDRTATDRSGTVHRWERLILATGSEAVVPEAFSQGSPLILPISNPEGAESLRSLVQAPGRTLLVVGGGPLGVETAWNLAQHGHRVTLVHRGGRLLGPFVDEDGARRVGEQWQSRGIEVRVSVREQSFVETGGRCRVSFSEGAPWEGDAVVVACGTLPRTDLARKAGLLVGPSGVVVDSRGQTSHTAVFAIGDCAAPLPGEVPGLWEPARRRVDRLVAHWTGAPAPEPQGPPLFRLKTDWPVVSRGDPETQGRMTSVQTAEAAWRAVETPDGLSFWQVLGPVTDLEQRVAVLESGSVLLNAVPAGEAASWPDGHIVCDCHQVSAATVRQAWAAGAPSLADLGRSIQAGTSCGNCRPRLLDLAQKYGVSARWTRAFRRPRWHGWSWRDAVGYGIDYGMLVSGLLTALTGVLKMPGFLDAVGLDQRSLPDEVNMALSALLDLHDWPGIVLTLLALVHAFLHWGMMVAFVKSWFKKG